MFTTLDIIKVIVWEEVQELVPQKFIIFTAPITFVERVEVTEQEAELLVPELLHAIVPTSFLIN